MANINSDNCNHCSSCYSCYSCYYCNFCDSCYYCNHCSSCNSCYYCNHCSSCYSCINLKKTEYNYFCYADDKCKDGFQRPKYQVFNKQLTEEEYYKIKIVKLNLEFDENEDSKTRYKTAFKKAWDKLSEENKNKITSLPGFNKEDFKKYYGVDIDGEIEQLGEDEIVINGITYIKK